MKKTLLSLLVLTGSCNSLFGASSLDLNYIRSKNGFLLPSEATQLTENDEIRGNINTLAGLTGLFMGKTLANSASRETLQAVAIIGGLGSWYNYSCLQEKNFNTLNGSTRVEIKTPGPIPPYFDSISRLARFCTISAFTGLILQH